MFHQPEVPLYYGRELVETAGAPLVEDSNELRDQLMNVLSQPEVAQAWLERASKFIHDFACAYGDEAVDNIVNAVSRVRHAQGS